MTTLERTAITIPINITLRPARQADLPKLEWYGQYAHFRNIFRRTFREQLRGRRLMLIADANNFPIGHIFIHLNTDNGDARAYLYSFRVMEMFRGRGIGTRLLQRAEAIAAHRGFRWTTIAVAKDNPQARRLYERLGYPAYADDNGDWSFVDHEGRTQNVHEPCWLMEKQIKPR